MIVELKTEIQVEGIVRAFADKSVVKKAMIVGGKSYNSSPIRSIIQAEFSKREIQMIRFDKFTANPCIESVYAAVSIYLDKKCDILVAVGGGSAIDVAKGIVFYGKHAGANFNGTLAVPTTAGTGSESTQFAVIYENGKKLSLEREDLLPTDVILWEKMLRSLPIYQRKVTMLDALCHAIESYWSVRASAESKAYSKIAIEKIQSNYLGYLQNQEYANGQMLLAANYAGQAINIAKTTAGHALSYRLSSTCNIAHGQAVAVCLIAVWCYMLQMLEQNSGTQGQQCNLKDIQKELARVLGVEKPADGIRWLQCLYDSLELPALKNLDTNVLAQLADNVNIERLNNHPMKLDRDDIIIIYRTIMEERCE